MTIPVLKVLLMLGVLLWQESVPLKPADEYEVLIDYKFQDRHVENRYKADYDVGAEDRKIRATGPLPYLRLQVKLLKLGENEVKVKVMDSDGNLVYNRKAEVGAIIKLDLGFIDDVKDRMSPHEFNVLFSSNDKTTVSRIQLLVMEDGTFLVNNVTRGKF